MGCLLNKTNKVSFYWAFAWQTVKFVHGFDMVSACQPILENVMEPMVFNLVQ